MCSASGKQVAAKFFGQQRLPSQLLLNSEVDTGEVELLSVNRNGTVDSLILFMSSIESQEVRTEKYRRGSRSPEHRVGYHQSKLQSGFRIAYYQSKLQEEGWVTVKVVRRRGRMSIVGVGHNRWLKKLLVQTFSQPVATPL
jgi:hypothetical protein